MLSWLGFGIGSLALTAISWRSLTHPRSHGFFRFLAWETMLALFFINAKYWFEKPFAWNQIVAWTLLILCLLPLAFGVNSLRTHGKPEEQREGDPSLLAFEKTTSLVTDGIYKYIRHPLYSSLFLLTWGTFFKLPSPWAAVLSILATIFLFLTAKADEAECVQFFGPQYAEYMKHTKRFIPYIF